MAVVTTYVCDVSGKQGDDKTQFVTVEVGVTKFMNYGTGMASSRANTITKLIHVDVANKLCLLPPDKMDDPKPQPTFESQLTTLLKDYINDIVYEEVSTQISNRN